MGKTVVVSQLVAMLLTGCHSWHIAVSVVTPEQLIGTDHPKMVRVECITGEWLEIGVPEVRHDTLFGRVARETVAIPLREIVTISVNRGNLERSVLWGFGILNATFWGLGLLIAATGGIMH